jgi:hypothetical protein
LFSINPANKQSLFKQFDKLFRIKNRLQNKQGTQILIDGNYTIKKSVGHMIGNVSKRGNVGDKTNLVDDKFGAENFWKTPHLLAADKT